MPTPEPTPTAALLIIGNEVLSGKIVDQNGPYMIRALRGRGVETVEVRIIPDVVEVIAAAVAELAPQVTYLFTSGGIGPTHDDVTVAGVARGFGRAVVRHADIEARLRALKGSDLRPAHLKMADVPEGATVRFVESAYFPLVQVENTTLLPGIPKLLQRGFELVTSELTGHDLFGGALLLATTETRIAAELTRLQDAHPKVAIGSYPREEEGRWVVKITFDGRDPEELTETMTSFERGLEPGVVLERVAPRPAR